MGDYAMSVEWSQFFNKSQSPVDYKVTSVFQHYLFFLESNFVLITACGQISQELKNKNNFLCVLFFYDDERIFLSLLCILVVLVNICSHTQQVIGILT